MNKKGNIQVLDRSYLETISNIHNQGNEYLDKGEYNKALTCFEESLQLRVQYLGTMHPDVADSYNNIGNTYYHKGLYDKALEAHLQCKQIRTNLLDVNDIALAQTYNNIGICHDAQGFHSKALAYYNKSLDLRSRHWGENHPSVAQIYNNLGLCYFSKQLFDNALFYLNKALDIRRTHFGIRHSTVAQTLLNIGVCFYSKEEFDEALRYYEQSLELKKAIDGNKHPNTTIALNNMGLCYQRKGLLEKALKYHYEVLDIRLLTLGKDHPSLAYVHNDTANCLAKMGKFQVALQSFQNALQIVIPDFTSNNVLQNPPIHQYSDAQILLDILQSKAYCLQKMHVELKESVIDYGFHALKVYQLAAQLMRQIRRGYKAESTRLTLAEKAHQMYEAAIETAISNDAIALAFTFAEQGKGIVLLSSLKDVDARLAANIPEKWLREANELRVQLTELDNAIRNERNKLEANRNREALRNWQNQHFDYQRQYESLIERLEQEFPNYFQLKYDVHTIELPQLQASLDEQTAIIEFFVGSRQTYVWAIGQNFVWKQIVNISEKELSEQVEDLIEAIYAENLKEYQALAHHLFQILLKDCLNQTHFNDIQTLQIIPDSSLNFLPFETLLTAPFSSNQYTDLNYLVKRYAISYHYSSTLWQYGKYKQNEQSHSMAQFVGFAPVYATDSSNDTKQYYPTLLHSAVEIEQIKQAFQQKGHLANTFLHAEASKECFQNQIATYNYVHIAAHAFSQPHIQQEELPTLEGIVFSLNSKNADSFLTMAEIYNLTLKADLVVLSCCDSGVGKIAKGEGVMAINRGFLYAGAKNVIYTLFKVYDQQSAELMQYLYREILEEKTYSLALQTAKFEMISQNFAPKYWAGFVLIGGK